MTRYAFEIDAVEDVGFSVAIRITENGDEKAVEQWAFVQALPTAFEVIRGMLNYAEEHGLNALVEEG